MSASSEFGMVVRMEQDSITAPAGSLHRSHNPANANRELSRIPKWNGCFSLPLRDHSKNPSAGSKHRRLVKASRKAGLLAIVSARALIVLKPILASLAQVGIRPQRASEKCRSGLDGSWRIMPTGCDGAML